MKLRRATVLALKKFGRRLAELTVMPLAFLLATTGLFFGRKSGLKFLRDQYRHRSQTTEVTETLKHDG
jgi:hypothetical protein